MKWKEKKVFSITFDFILVDTAAANSLASNAGGSAPSASSVPNTPVKQRMNPIVVLEECSIDDYAPLFYSPGKCGFYSPREGFASYERLNAFRNVGRYAYFIKDSQQSLIHICI